MKNITTKPLVIIGLLTFSLSCFGQENNTLKTSKNIKTVNSAKSVSNPEEKKITSTNQVQTVSIGERRVVLTTQEKIEALESHIEAIDKKVDYINADSDLKNKAIQENWFDKMQAIREELVLELSELKSE